MAYTEIDRENKKIKFYFPTNKPAKRIKEWQEELKAYDIEIIPQNTITDEQMKLCYILFDQFKRLGFGLYKKLFQSIVWNSIRNKQF